MGGGGSKQAAAPTPQMTPQDASQAVQDFSVIPESVFPMWPTNTTVDVSMYISPSIAMPPFNKMSADSLILHETNFGLEKSKKDGREIHTSFSVPKPVQDNGTLWAHVFVGQHGAVLDPASAQYDSKKAYRMTRPLTQYLAKRKVRKTRNLLEAQNESEIQEEIVEETGPQIASYYHPNFTLAFIPDAGGIQWNSLPPAVKQYYIPDVDNSRDETGKNGFFYPVLFLNTFWQLKTHMYELNSTHPIERLDMNVQLSTLANWQFNILATMDESMKETARKAAHGETSPGGGDGSEF